MSYQPHNHRSEEDTDLSSTMSEPWDFDPQIPSIPPQNPNVAPNATNATDPAIPVGLSDPVLSNIRRKKLDLVNRLHNLGTQRDIDLPVIVVIGSQSAGKSSLIESISGINLPRSGGTCTRCPTECRLISTPDDPWQCVVSLRFLTDANGTRLDAAQNIPFGALIKNPQDVEERLRRAQLAILNPSVPPEVFLDTSRPLEKPALNFSNNIVCLEIKGPHVTDLSFCDLPGLIASVADGGRDEDVDEVRELVASYIQKESCIILLTVTCEVDFETQGAYRLARKYDPEGVRTIGKSGVLTKPDRIPEGDSDHARWLRLIKNESSPLKNGWFCVKQLSSVQLERGYTFEESRRLCENFFKEAHPWKSLDPLYQKRLGTNAVTVKLNEFLMSVITKRIPEIMRELQELIQNTKNNLRELPAPPSADPFLEVMHLINRFCNTLYNHCKGFNLDSSEGLVGNQFEGIREVQREFRMAIQETAPKFKPFARDENENEDDYLHLNDVSEMASRAVTRELPGFFPFCVVQKLIARSTDEWEKPAIDFINGIFNVVSDHQERLMDSHFKKYTGGGLYHIIKTLVNEYMQVRKETLENQVKWLLRLESSAFTLNNALLLNYKTTSLEGHKNTLRNHPPHYRDVSGDESALMIITTVEAYFQVAHNRFIDNVPLAVDHDLVRIEERALEEFLCKGLKLTGRHAAQNCARYLAESAEISDLRKELKKRLQRLTAAQTELLDI